MAVAAARLSFHLPSNLKSESFSPRIRLQPWRTLQRGPFSSVGPIFSSLVKEDRSLSFTEPEAALIEALLGIQGRGRAASPQQVKDVEDAVHVLEDLRGVPDPTSSKLIEGRWQLIFTTRPGTASPIQRTFVGVDIFKVFQEVFLKADDQRVSNIVKFSDAIGELKVEAAATIEDGKRILFQFDRAAFSFKFLPFKVPYPVPFRLLGDEAKGWLDTTYLSSSGNMRISRGNKGTIFVLQKRLEQRQRLLEAISNGSGVTEVIDELISLRKKKTERNLFVAVLMRQVIDELISLRKKNDEKYDETLEGEWQLVWASESEEESWEAIVADGLKGKQIVKKNGQLENLVDRFPGFKYCASGNFIRTSDNNTYTVSMITGYILVGGFKSPVEIKSIYTMELLYIDNKIRITRGNKDVMLVHLRLSRNKS